DQMEARPAGSLEWHISPVDDPPGTPAPFLRVVWAADYARRVHLRVLADRLTRGALADAVGLLGPVSLLPPAWLLFRAPAYQLQLPGTTEEVIYVCPCGATGTVAEIAWMGDRCGPCHDRAEAGEPVPTHFAPPTLPPGLPTFDSPITVT